MPKIKAICRDKNNFQRQNIHEIEKVFRNTNPSLHPQFKAREYVRALNSAKLDKIFAKPFIASLDKHTDGIKSMSKNKKTLNEVVSGGFDGQIILWDMSRKVPVFDIKSSHEILKGVVFSYTGNEFLSIGDDSKINLWNKTLLYETKDSHSINNNLNTVSLYDYGVQEIKYDPKRTFTINGSLESIDHSYYGSFFSTGGSTLSIWDYERSFPIANYTFVSDGFIKVKYNYVQENVLLATGYNRSINLIDVRSSTPTHQVQLQNKSSAACWNPQEPFVFTIGNEDSNCYTFDMRRLEKAVVIHKDHYLAVLDLDYSPTGKEFVTGSFDKTVRIWGSSEGKSREVYHNKRMQKVFSVQYTLDERYVLSGSDDANIRIWKSNASEPYKLMTERESQTLNYRKKLIEKFKYNPEVKRIIRKRNLPKYLVNQKNVRQVQKESKFKKMRNLERNSRAGTVDYSSERMKKIDNTGVIDGK